MTLAQQISRRRHWARGVLLLGLALTLLAASCSSDSDSEEVEAAALTTTSAAPSESTTAPAEEPADPTTTAPASTTAPAQEAPEPPRNDLFENAVVIDPAALPFTDSVDTAGATTDDDDPIPPCTGEWPTDASIWYSITPTSDERLLLNLHGTEYSYEIAVATGEPGSFELVHCRPFSWVLEAEANVTYHLRVIDDQWDGNGYNGVGNGGNTHLTVDALPEAPVNDLIEDALVIDPAALPFTDSVNTTGAGSGAEDDGVGCPAPATHASVWYTFTPTTDMRLRLSGDGTDYSVGVGAGREDPREDDPGECRPDELTLDVKADVTYLISLFDGQEDGGGNGGNLEFSLEEAPE
jgi:hypothetical protein